jgi:hypothetical protein
VDDENYIDIVQVEKGTQTDENLMDGGCKNYIRVYAFLDYAITRLGHKDEQKALDFINFLKLIDKHQYPLDNMSFLLFLETVRF